MSDPDGNQDVALRFWGGDLAGQTVRFTFPEALFFHLKDIELIGSDGSTTTPQELFNKAETVDFLRDNTSPRDHLAHGSNGRGDIRLCEVWLRWENGVEQQFETWLDIDESIEDQIFDSFKAIDPATPRLEDFKWKLTH